MRDTLFQQLEARWHELFDQYETVRSSLPPVVRWEWTNRPRYDPRPFHFKIHPTRGRVIKPPTDEFQKIHCHEYGFDDQGRVIVDYFYVTSGRVETFYHYLPNKIEIATFDMYRQKLVVKVLAHAVMESGLMRHYVSLKILRQIINPPSETSELLIRMSKESIRRRHTAYSYEGKRLTYIHEYDSPIVDRYGPFELDERFEYDAKGHLQKIVRTVAGRQFMLYRKRELGETRAILAERAKTKLIQAIPQIVAKAQFAQTLYCLTLNYESGSIDLPPKLIPGFESYRQQAIREMPPHYLRSGYVWVNMWHFETDEDDSYPPLPITDPEVLEACENLNSDVRRTRDYHYEVRVLREIARELNKLDWSQYAPITPDFIVYACDQTEHEDIAASLRYSGATKAQMDDWRKRGLL